MTTTTTIYYYLVAAAALLATSASAFAPTTTSTTTTTTFLSSAKDVMPERMWNSMVEKSERSKALPFLPRPKNLDGSMVGDVGFDPFYLSSIPKNFAGFLQPPSWEPTQGLPTLYWMRESELKHCRIAMMAVTGWIATDLGARFPLAIFQDIPNAYSAHDILVQQGTMAVMLLAVGFVEITTGAVLVQVSKGELVDREAGNFGWDPPGMLKGKSQAYIKDMELKEINNGRIAMLAFGGIATQTALGSVDFPYF